MATLIHPTAIIDPSADLHPTVEVGPYAVIGSDVKIGANTRIASHVVIEGPTIIGERNRFFPNSSIGLEPQDLKYQGGASRLRIGNDNVFRECVTINRATYEDEETIIGNNNLLMAYVHVAHNCRLEDQIIIANSVALAGHVEIESKAVIGGVLGVHQFVHIGRMAMLGGMSRIDRDVPPYMLVEGNPGRVRSLNLIGLKRGGLDLDEIKLLKQSFRLLYGSELNFTVALDQLAHLSSNPHVQHLFKFLKNSILPPRRGPLPGKSVNE